MRSRGPLRRRLIAAAIALGVVALGPPPFPSDDAPRICDICKQGIEGRYLEENGRSYHEGCWVSHRAPRCAVCGRVIRETRVESGGKAYHRDCYRRVKQPRCAICRNPIEGEYRVEGDLRYHPACHRVRATRCAVCGEALTGSFLADGWGNPFHARHGTDLLCPYCNRLMVPAVTGGSRFDRAAGATVCGKCAAGAVRDPAVAGRVVERVRRRLAKLFPVPKESFSWELSDRDRLRSLAPEREGSGHELGITLSVEARKDGRVSRRIEVHLLRGLPAWLLEAVAAHELAHVWQHRQGRGNLPPDQAEGTAELAAYLALSASTAPEAAVKIQAMRASPDPAYGAGFRRALTLSKEGRDPARLREILHRRSGWSDGT